MFEKNKHHSPPLTNVYKPADLERRMGERVYPEPKDQDYETHDTASTYQMDQGYDVYKTHLPRPETPILESGDTVSDADIKAIQDYIDSFDADELDIREFGDEVMIQRLINRQQESAGWGDVKYEDIVDFMRPDQVMTYYNRLTHNNFDGNPIWPLAKRIIAKMSFNSVIKNYSDMDPELFESAKTFIYHHLDDFLGMLGSDPDLIASSLSPNQLLTRRHELIKHGVSRLRIGMKLGKTIAGRSQ